jgi:hypothetical protein
MSSRWLPSLAVLLMLASSTMAEAAILIEARKQQDTLRMVIDAEQQRALIVTPRGQSVVDLESHRIYLRGAAGGARQVPIAPSEGNALGGYRVSPWGPGPVIAGHATVYHVITYRRGDLRRDAGERLDAAVHGAGGAGFGSAGRHARPGAGSPPPDDGPEAPPCRRASASPPRRTPQMGTRSSSSTWSNDV